MESQSWKTNNQKLNQIEPLAGERVDDLQLKGLRIIQNPSQFCFGMDAVLLTAFCRLQPEEEVLDLCSGNGVIPILLAGKHEGVHVTGLEIQEGIVEMASRSVQMNGLEQRVKMIQGDVRQAQDLWRGSSFDAITCNPPYMIAKHGLTNEASPKAIARHEVLCTLDDVIEQAARLVRPGGRFFMIHRPFRISEILCKMTACHLEPKRMRLVYPYIDHEPNMVLIEGVRNGRPRMTVEPPLIVYQSKNVYTEEVKKLYG